MSDKATLHAEPAAIGADDAAAARTIPGADEQANGHANGQANGHVGARPGASARKRTAFTEPDVDDGGAPRNPTRSETMNSRGSRRSGHRQESNGSMLSRISSMLKPEHKLGKDPTLKASAMAIVKASWLNVLLVFIPVGWALHFAIPTSYLAVFITNFIAIIPLAKLLGFATEELAMRVGQTLGGLMNATLGNLVELIVAIIALVKCELRVVQSSLLGSILSNLLLVLGMCFFAGGLKYSELGFKPAGAQVNSSLLIIAVIAILLPAGFNATFSNTLSQSVERDDILKMSRAAAVILLVCYLAYLIFQLYSHAHFFAEDDADTDCISAAIAITLTIAVVEASKPIWGDHHAFKPARSTGNTAAARRRHEAEMENRRIEDADLLDDEEEETPSTSWLACILLLLGITVLVAVTAEFLVDSINGLTTQYPISEEWVGLILLPIVGNAAEHVTAVTVSVKDKLDLSIGVAVGSSIQIALFVIPLLTIIAWGMDKPLSLLFSPFESIVLFLSVLLVNYIRITHAALVLTASAVADSRANWLEGWLLMMCYLIIAVAFWSVVSYRSVADERRFYPSAETAADQLLQCNS